MAVNEIISRDSGTDPLIPEPVSAQVLQDMPAASAVLQRARRVTMGTRTQRMPVLDVLPHVEFLGSSTPHDTALKQTTKMDWKNVNLVVEELAAIVPIPEAYLDDSQVPIWTEVRPRLVEAIGATIDAAVLFGTDKPSTWGTALYTGAVAAGNTVIDGHDTTDLAGNVAELGEKLADDGYDMTGFVTKPGLNWRLVGLRSTDGIPIYTPNLQGAPGGTLYGYPLSEAKNGGWDSSEALLMGGDWTKAIIGMRQDITFKVFTEGVISDSSGNIVLNLMQQDAVALRVVMRLAYAVANPANRLQPTEASRFPFAFVQAESAAS